MSKPQVYNWLAVDEEAICATQDAAGAGSLIINGTLSNFESGLIPSVTFIGISRTVSINSDNDLHLVHFDVFGTYNGEPVSQLNITGPDGTGPVYTTVVFDTVTSVTVDGAANGIKVGSGTTGHTHWFLYDYNRALSIFSAQVVVEDDITYSLQATMDDVGSVAEPFFFDPTGAMTDKTESFFVSSLIGSFVYCAISITASTDGSLQATLMQTGIT